MKYAGVLLTDSPHYIDHLAPFCSLMNWPLIVCEPAIAETIRRFYPDLDVIQSDPFQLELPPYIVACETRPLLDAFFGPFRQYTGKHLWLPHGLSDKGWKTPFFEALQDEDLLLVYGQRMRDVLLAKNINIPQISIGNFRWEYYQRHKAFYDKMFSKRHVLYAPTWEDADNNGTFWEALPKLKNVLVKPHPNTIKKYHFQLQNVDYLDNFPPIYPLLAHTDIYIGDMSSIGYDFLKFNRPMYFICREKRNDQSSFLMQAGTQITLDEIDLIQPGVRDHSWLYNHAFDTVPNWTQEVNAWLR